MEQPLIIESIAETKNCVILLHGLGANKYDFQSVAEYLRSKLPHTKFILPQAPTRPVTLNAGYPMPAWYDIISLDEDRKVNIAELDASAQTVVELIEQQKQYGIESKDIVIAGFSQGGAVVYHTAVNYYDQPLAGVMALSSYGPSLNDDIKLTPTRLQTAFIALHGTQDQVLKLSMGKLAYTRLKDAGAQITWFEYPMQHQVLPDEILDMENWLIKLFN